jgi:hypothetical protein
VNCNPNCNPRVHGENRGRPLWFPWFHHNASGSPAAGSAGATSAVIRAVRLGRTQGTSEPGHFCRAVPMRAVNRGASTMIPF